MQEPGFDDDYPDFSVEERLAEWEAKTPAEQEEIIQQNMKLHESFLMMDDDHW
jgi:hypothetical protein